MGKRPSTGSARVGNSPSFLRSHSRRHRHSAKSQSATLRVAGLLGILLMTAAVLRIGYAVQPYLSETGKLVPFQQTWVALLPDWFSFSIENILETVRDQFSSLLLRYPDLSEMDTLVVWVAAGVVGLLLWRNSRSRWRQDALAPRRSSGSTAHTTPAPTEVAPGRELSHALRSFKLAVTGVATFSGASNVLMLTGAVFMLQVYDRVLPSRSVPTLVALMILASTLFAGQAIIDVVRGRIMSRIGATLDEAVGARVFAAITRLPLSAGYHGDGLQPQRDLDSIRTFLASPGPNAFFELPWLPFYLTVIWSLHPVLGITAICGTLILVTLTATTEYLTRKSMSEAVSSSIRRNSIAGASRCNAEAITAMGMGQRLYERWRDAGQDYLNQQQRISDVVGGLGSVSRVLRLMLQSAMLGVGAWLVIHQEATAGIIIAGSILAGRALAPVDFAIAHWRNFVGARQSWRRLSECLAQLPPEARPMALPPPSSSLTVDKVTVGTPGQRRIVVQGVEFSLEAGTVLGIVGPSGSGKTSLVRVLVGAWRPLTGCVRLDGASLDQWSPERLGQHLGYLPQDVELFEGTVANNIARFEPNANPEAIVAAARAAGVHDLIVSGLGGYEAQIGEGGVILSAGQRQRIALARVLYQDPFLVVMDEPNSNLDTKGETALIEAITAVKVRRGIVVVVTHRSNILTKVDFILAMNNGRMQAFGPREGLMSALASGSPAPTRILKAVDPTTPHQQMQEGNRNRP